MGHKQDGAGHFIPYAKHIRKKKYDYWNKGVRRRIRQAIQKSPDEPLNGLKHK